MNKVAPSTLEDEIRRVAWEYGKLGLLIDDSSDRAARVARALYGSEALPHWWKQASSLVCACRSLEVFLKLFQDEQLGGLRGLVIIDRYLPLHCGGGRAFAWDRRAVDVSQEEEQYAESMRDKVRLLRSTELARHDIGGQSVYHVIYVTSFPPVSSEVVAEEREMLDIHWQTRSVELLQEERRCLQKGSASRRNSDERGWRALLRFGPQEEPPVLRGTLPTGIWNEVQANSAKWRASTWARTIDRLAYLLRRECPVVLLTGAGASLAVGPTAPGMPLTDSLLDDACRVVVSGSSPMEDPPCRELASSPGCLCQSVAEEQDSESPWSEEQNVSPLDWLVEAWRRRGTVRGLEWRLEYLFSRNEHKNRSGKLDFDLFHKGFRRALYHWDYGYGYHHWLLARLPWAAIVTTNFDGFHERAATAVATLPWIEDLERAHSLRLGMRGDDPDVRISNPELQQARGVLFKPYGSLYSPDGSIALSFAEIAGFKTRFFDALKKALHLRKGGPGALVVLGHAMRDKSIDSALSYLQEELREFELYWVDPKSYACCSTNAQEASSWAGMNGRYVRSDSQISQEERKAELSGSGGPVVATALEFACDLWSAFQERRER